MVSERHKSQRGTYWQRADSMATSQFGNVVPRTVGGERVSVCEWSLEWSQSVPIGTPKDTPTHGGSTGFRTAMTHRSESGHTLSASPQLGLRACCSQFAPRGVIGGQRQKRQRRLKEPPQDSAMHHLFHPLLNTSGDKGRESGHWRSVRDARTAKGRALKTRSVPLERHDCRPRAQRPLPVDQAYPTQNYSYTRDHRADTPPSVQRTRLGRFARTEQLTGQETVRLHPSSPCMLDARATMQRQC